jgi:hypothetical protein
LPWERGAYVNAVYAFVGTILSLTFRPGRRRRSLSTESGAASAVLFFVLLIPTACALSVAVCFLAAKFGQIFPALIRHDAYWELSLWSKKPRYCMGELISVLIRAIAFMLTGLLVWLPALVALDLTCWRERSAFRLAVKGLAYSSVWWFWSALLAAGLLREVLYQIAGERWYWGWGGAWSSTGYWPWPSWLAASVLTLQVVHVFLLTRSARSALQRRARRCFSLSLLGGWICALYLLIFDRFVHLRFHLQFISDELDFLYRWLRR